MSECLLWRFYGTFRILKSVSEALLLPLHINNAKMRRVGPIYDQSANDFLFYFFLNIKVVKNHFLIFSFAFCKFNKFNVIVYEP